MDNQHETHEPPKPKGEYLTTRLTDGRVVNLSEAIRNEQETGEEQINTALLRQGDVVAMLATPADNQPANSLLYRVEDTEWRHLGATGSHGPRFDVAGNLQGSNVPEELTRQRTYLAGSGFGLGSSSLQYGTIVTGRTPFFFADNREIQAAPIAKLKVYRRNTEGELRALTEQQLAAEAVHDTDRHLERLQRAEELMRVFGFDAYDFRDCKQVLENDIDSLAYSDERYEAQYTTGQAMGNTLAILDKRTGQWTELKYFNFNNQDTLQISFADLPQQDWMKLFRGFQTEESAIYRSGAAIATHTTSNWIGLNAANYHPERRECADILSLSGYSDDGEYEFAPRPDIQIFPDRTVKIDGQYPFDQMEAKQPGLLEAMAGSIHADTSHDGITTLTFGQHTVNLKNPDTALVELKSAIGKKE